MSRSGFPAPFVIEPKTPIPSLPSASVTSNPRQENGRQPQLTVILIHGRGTQGPEFARDFLSTEFTGCRIPSPLPSPSLLTSSSHTLSKHYTGDTSTTVTTPENHGFTADLEQVRDALGASLYDDLYSRPGKVYPGGVEGSAVFTLTERFPMIRWIFPSSRSYYSSTFDEPSLPQWFDCPSLSDTERGVEVQRPGLKESIEFLAELIEREPRPEGVNAECEGGGQGRHVIIAGTSLGLATAVHLLLYLLSARFMNGDMSDVEAVPETSDRQQDRGAVLAFFGWSGWLPLMSTVENIANQEEEEEEERDGAAASSSTIPQALKRLYLENLGIKSYLDDGKEPSEKARVETNPRLSSIPVFLSHSVDDPFVDIEHGKKMQSVLRRLGLNVTWREFEDGGHWLKSPEDIDQLAQFMDEVLKKLERD